MILLFISKLSNEIGILWYVIIIVNTYRGCEKYLQIKFSANKYFFLDVTPGPVVLC